MICQLQIIFFFCPFSILQYKFLSYREVPHVLSESSELIELPEVFSSMEKALLHQALRLEDLLLELRFVSRSSETSGTSQSPISFHPAFPDVGMHMTHLQWKGPWWSMTCNYIQYSLVDL